MLSAKLPAVHVRSLRARLPDRHGLRRARERGRRRRLRSRRDGTERQVRPRHQGRRRARSEPSLAARATSARRTAGSRRSRRRSRPERRCASSTPRASSSRRARRPALAHVFPYGSAIGIPADELAASKCATTCVSAGDASANNFAAFRRHIAAQTRHAPLRLRRGSHRPDAVPGRRALRHRLRPRDACAKAVAENADMAIGVEVRMSENIIAERRTEPFKRAIMACEKPHRRQDEVVVGSIETRELMSQILDLLRPGNVLSHPIPGAEHRRPVQRHLPGRASPAGASPRSGARGVVFDVGHGGGFDYTVCEAAKSGLPARHDLVRHPLSPATRRASPISPGMSASSWPRLHARAGGRDGDVGAREGRRPAAEARDAEVGAPADVSILELVQGPVAAVDTRNNTRTGHVQTVTGGIPAGRPYNSPFAVRWPRRPLPEGESRAGSPRLTRASDSHCQRAREQDARDRLI